MFSIVYFFIKGEKSRICFANVFHYIMFKTSSQIEIF